MSVIRVQGTIVILLYSNTRHAIFRIVKKINKNIYYTDKRNRTDVATKPHSCALLKRARKWLWADFLVFGIILLLLSYRHRRCVVCGGGGGGVGGGIK